MEIIHGMVCFIDPQYTSMVIFTSRGPRQEPQVPYGLLKCLSTFRIRYITYHIMYMHIAKGILLKLYY